MTINRAGFDRFLAKAGSGGYVHKKSESEDVVVAGKGFFGKRVAEIDARINVSRRRDTLDFLAAVEARFPGANKRWLRGLQESAGKAPLSTRYIRQVAYHATTKREKLTAAHDKKLRTLIKKYPGRETLALLAVQTKMTGGALDNLFSMSDEQKHKLEFIIENCPSTYWAPAVGVVNAGGDFGTLQKMENLARKKEFANWPAGHLLGFAMSDDPAAIVALYECCKKNEVPESKWEKYAALLNSFPDDRNDVDFPGRLRVFETLIEKRVDLTGIEAVMRLFQHNFGRAANILMNSSKEDIASEVAYTTRHDVTWAFFAGAVEDKFLSGRKLYSLCTEAEAERRHDHAVHFVELGFAYPVACDMASLGFNRARAEMLKQNCDGLSISAADRQSFIRTANIFGRNPTHVLQAVGNRSASEFESESRTAALTAEGATPQMIAALAHVPSEDVVATYLDYVHRRAPIPPRQ